jgi:hypothetical protein
MKVNASNEIPALIISMRGSSAMPSFFVKAGTVPVAGIAAIAIHADMRSEYFAKDFAALFKKIEFFTLGIFLTFYIQQIGIDNRCGIDYIQ